MRRQRQNHPTTFVITDPYHFRSVVQELTGAPPEISSSSSSSASFNLDEGSKKMKLTVNTTTNPYDPFSQFLVSPVSHFDPFWTYVSPHSTPEEHHIPLEDEVEKAIAEKGFYLLPSPRRSSTDPPPKLLELFPLRSPNTTNHHN